MERDAEPCKDCRAYREQFEAWLTYDADWVLSQAVLPKPPRVSRKPHLVNGKSTPGDRCTTHWRAKRTRDRAASHARRTLSVYTLPISEYEALKEFQGGTCAICRRAKGVTKRLAVDHDHTCCSGKTSCGNCVRGLLCSPCNSVLAHFRDDRAAFMRAWRYLTLPPYTEMKIGGTW